MTEIILTRRALFDLKAIDEYSVEAFGPDVAMDYLDAFDDAFDLLQRSPELLRQYEDFSLRLRFYRVRKHFIICDLIDDRIYVLAVVHASMDLPNRIGELEPTLAREVELLHRQYIDSFKDKKR